MNKYFYYFCKKITHLFYNTLFVRVVWCMKPIDAIKNIKIEDFDYPLPDERIPRHPLADRASCKLLARSSDGTIKHMTFSDLPGLLPKNALLVCNDTRVINARIAFYKETGSRIEVFLLEPLSPEDYVLMFQSCGCCEWSCMVGNLKRWKDKPLVKIIEVDGKKVELKATRLEPRPGNCHRIRFEWDADVTFASIIEAAGNIPIPPYLKRETEETDSEDYQTVYALEKGSVAAPTAGLHFTPVLMDEIRGKGVDIAPLTLHVGAGTFQPVKSETIGDHPMHTEVFSISLSTLDKIIAKLQENEPIIAVGTTSVRTLESLPYIGRRLKNDEALTVEQWEAYMNPIAKADVISYLKVIKDYMIKEGLKNLTASTSIMIAPGYGWNIVEKIITNFHQPQSTLLLLVSSFLEKEKVGGDNVAWREVYDEALKQDYRFLSYGDACYFE